MIEITGERTTYRMDLLRASVESDASGAKALYWSGTLTFACYDLIHDNQDLRIGLECWLDADRDAPSGVVIDDTGDIREFSGLSISYSTVEKEQVLKDYERTHVEALVTVRYRARRRLMTRAIRPPKTTAGTLVPSPRPDGT